MPGRALETAQNLARVRPGSAAERFFRETTGREGDTMVLLRGFIKKERKAPKAELDLAKQRLKKFRSAR